MNPSPQTQRRAKPIPERLGQIIGRIRAKQLELAQLGQTLASARYADRAKRVAHYAAAAA